MKTKPLQSLAIVYIYYYNIFVSKQYYIQLLLTFIQSLSSYKNLQIINNILYPIL